MKKKVYYRLTNEQLRPRFRSQFDLVTYAIGQATGMIQTGRPARVKTDILNVAHQVLEEIVQGKDAFEVSEEKKTEGIHPVVMSDFVPHKTQHGPV